MKFRHELKIEISPSDCVLLRMRLRTLMKRDANGENGKYEIRSLYFDTMDDRVLMEKIDGVNEREKYRLRLYNGNADFIKLEVKRKISGLTNKESAVISRERAEEILSGNTAWMAGSDCALIRNLHDKMKYEGLRPKTIVAYTREAFLYDAGNVRITLDYDIRTGAKAEDFLKRECTGVPVWQDRYLLEVKWDEFLPDIIRDAVRIDGRSAGAFSKYAQARIFG